MNMFFNSLIYVPLGIILGILMVVFNIPLTFENILYLFLILFVLFFTIYIIDFVIINKKFKKYLEDPNSNLEELEKKLRKIKNNMLRTNFLINLSVAYSIKDDYKAALGVLNSIDINKMNERIKIIYYNDLAYFLLKNGNIKKATEVLNENRELFNKYLSDIQLASNLKTTIEEIETNNK